MNETQPVRYNERQLANMASSTLFAAELIRGGAYFDQAVGSAAIQLYVTPSQLEALHDPDGFEERKHRWLSADLETAWGDIRDPRLIRAWFAVARDGVKTRQDLFVLGKEWVRDVRNIGDKSVDVIAAQLVNNFGIAWEDRPTVSDMQSVCNGLGEVHSRVLEAYGAKLMVGDVHRRYVVQDILDTPPQERGNFLYGDTVEPLNRALQKFTDDWLSNTSE